MNHPVTLGGLVSVGLIIAGLIILVGGGSWVFGAGMSSNPRAAGIEGRKGCTFAVIGLILLALGLWSMFR